MNGANFSGLLVLAAGLITAHAAVPNVDGEWARDDGQTRITISPCGDAVCAINTWVRDPEGDEKLGDTLVMKLRPKSSTVLSGDAYDTRRQMTYSMTITLGPSGMETHGCVLFGVLCKTAEWIRMRQP